MDKPKTVRVRIAVAVDETGDWSASGWRLTPGRSPAGHYDEMQGIALDGVMGKHVVYHWIEADIPIPEETTHVVEPIAAGEHHEPS